MISCVLPTTARRRAMIPAACRQFLRQEVDAELIVASEDDVRDCLPNDTRVRLIATPRGEPLGVKRNRTNAAARGSWLAHWDDDDWRAPDFLAAQLRAADADIVAIGRRQPLYLDVQTGRFYRYRPHVPGPWICGGAAIYRRELWARHPFPGVARGSDTLWASRALAGARLAVREDPRFVALASYGAVQTGMRGWRWPPTEWRPVTPSPDLLCRIRLDCPWTKISSSYALGI